MIDKKQDKKALRSCRKGIYARNLFPYIQVEIPEVKPDSLLLNIVNTVKGNNMNAPVYIYDTSGPFSDPNMKSI